MDNPVPALRRSMLWLGLVQVFIPSPVRADVTTYPAAGVAINGRELPETLGTNGDTWAWQKAGPVTLEKGNAVVALHDLTGFNGRCDAIFLTLAPQAQPENEKQKVAEFRRKITKTEGVPAPATYHPGGYGSKYEGYHFKDTGHLGVYPRPNEKLNDPKVKERIQALGVQHMK